MPSLTIKQRKTNIMKRILYISLALISFGVQAQEKETKESKEVSTNGEKDTTRFTMGNSEIIIISKGEDKQSFKIEEIDTIDASPKKKNRDNEAHWAGIDFGVTSMMDQYGGTEFNNYPLWRNDPSKSWYFNLNLLEKKFKIVKEYVGLTTGLGFSWKSYGFRDNLDVVVTSDTITGTPSGMVYSKNKLRTSFLTVPLLLEFNTHADNDEGFYLSAGVIGGVRMTSSIRKEGEINGSEFESKQKGDYALNSFSADATVRLGYKNWGAHATYALLPMFNTGQTLAVHPVSFGLSFNF